MRTRMMVIWLQQLKTGIILLLIFPLSGFSQSIKRQTTAASVGSESAKGVNISQTIGQPYQTKTIQSDGFSYRPGFQQPVFSTEIINATIKVTVIPNPALLSFFIECSDTLLNAELSCYDEAGRMTYSEHMLTFKKHEVQCANWANGAYMITVTDKKSNLVTAKLIKTQ